MKKGYFDEKDSEWLVPILDKCDQQLNLRKQKTRYARDKYDKTKKKSFEIKKVVWAQQTGSKDKIIVLQEIAWSHKSSELRVAYYTTTRKGKWWWGQFALMIPKEDFEELILFAREKGLL